MDPLIGLGLFWIAAYIAVTSVTKNRWTTRFAIMTVVTVAMLSLFFGWTLIGEVLGGG